MKFLCVSCDEPMKLMKIPPVDRGSLTVVYRCPKCDHEIAMLTNPFETQVVSSLGVNIGAGPSEGGDESKCPFTSMAQDAGADPIRATSGLSWSADASARLDNLPEFARPLAKNGIEKYARERGLVQIDTRVLDDARESLGI